MTAFWVVVAVIGWIGLGLFVTYAIGHSGRDPWWEDEEDEP